MKNPFKKAFKTINAHVKKTELENEFIPKYGIIQGDRKRFWDNYDIQLVNKISQIKNETL